MMTKAVDAYSYIRFSTDPQKMGDSERRQLERCREYAAKHGLHHVEEIKDTGISAFRGKNIADGRFGIWLALVRAKKIKAGSHLLMEDWDRLTRDTELNSINIVTELLRAGIVIVTLRDEKKYDAQADLGDLITSLVSMARAHEESVRKSDHGCNTWKHKRDNAKNKPPTAVVPAWLEIPRLKLGEKASNVERRIKVNEKRAAIVRKIFELSVTNGWGGYAIAKYLNEKNIPTFGRSKIWIQSYVNKILGNRAVLGEYQFHKMEGRNKRIPVGEPIPDYFPPIIDQGLFQRAQDSRGLHLTPNGEGKGGRRSFNLFSSLLKCAYCAGPVYFQDKGTGYQYLYCHAARSEGKCDVTRGWQYRDFESSFTELVKGIDWSSIINQDDTAKSDLENEIAALRGERASIEKKQKRLVEIGTDIQVIRQQLLDLEQQSTTLTIKIETKVKELEAVTRDEKHFAESRDEIKNILPQNRSQIAAKLKSMIEAIYVATVGTGTKKRPPLAFMPGADEFARSLELGWKKKDGTTEDMHRSPFYIVKFRQASKLVAVFHHPEFEDTTNVFTYNWISKAAKK